MPALESTSGELEQTDVCLGVGERTCSVTFEVGGKSEFLTVTGPSGLKKGELEDCRCKNLLAVLM